MSKQNEPIEFGPNGAVLNSENISDELADQYRTQQPNWLEAILFKPSVWPPSALIMAFAGAVLLGVRVALGGGSQDARLLEGGALALIITAGWWRLIWQKKFDKVDRASAGK